MTTIQIAPELPKLEIHAAAMRRVQTGDAPSLEAGIEAEISARSSPKLIERVLMKFFAGERSLLRAEAEARVKLEAASMALKTERQRAVKLLNRRDSLTTSAELAAAAAVVAKGKLSNTQRRLAKATDAVERRVERGSYINHEMLLDVSREAVTCSFALKAVESHAAAAEAASFAAAAELANFLSEHAEDLAAVAVGKIEK